MHKIPIALGAVVSLLVLGAAAGAAQAFVSNTIYVSPQATSNGADISCSRASYSDINTAVAAVGPGGTGGPVTLATLATLVRVARKRWPSKNATSKARGKRAWTSTRSRPGTPSAATPSCPCAPRRCSGHGTLMLGMIEWDLRLRLRRFGSS